MSNGHNKRPLGLEEGPTALELESTHKLSEPVDERSMLPSPLRLAPIHGEEGQCVVGMGTRHFALPGSLRPLGRRLMFNKLIMGHRVYMTGQDTNRDPGMFAEANGKNRFMYGLT